MSQVIVHVYDRHGHMQNKEQRKSTALHAATRYTLVMEDLPTYQEAIEMITSDYFHLEVSAGLSLVHWKDEFCRKIGVDTAIQNMNSHMFVVSSFEVLPDRVILRLLVEEGEYYDSFISLEINKQDKPFINYDGMPYDGRVLAKALKANEL